MIGIGLNIGNRVMGGGGGAFDVDAQAFFDRVTTAGGTLTTTEKNATNQLVLDMKSAGIWTSMKAIYPMVGASVNLLSYTNTLTNAYWTSSQLALIGSQSDPNGGTNATKLIGSSATNAYIYGTALPTVVGQTYTASVYIKGDSSGSVSFRVDSGSSAPSNPINYTTTWQRFTYTFVAGYTGADFVIGGYNTWTGSETIYIYGPQLELGSTATTYAAVVGNRTTEAAAACAQNLKSSSFTGTFTSGWTFASTGVTPNGTSAYFDTNLIPGTTLSSSSASLGFVTNVANTNTSGIEMGVQSAVDGMSLWTQFSSSNTSRIGRGNDAGTGLPYTLAGRFYGSRTSSTLQTLYRNGSSVATGSGAVSGLDSVYKITLSALNLSGVPAIFANGRYNFAFIGDGLSSTNIANLDTAIVTFNTSLSR